MKQILILATVVISFCSCQMSNLELIEKYAGNGYIVAEKTESLSGYMNLRLKNKDTILWVTVLYIDSYKFDIGDTIK